jgi:hypothetical protein
VHDIAWRAGEKIESASVGINQITRDDTNAAAYRILAFDNELGPGGKAAGNANFYSRHHSLLG